MTRMLSVMLYLASLVWLPSCSWWAPELRPAEVIRAADWSEMTTVELALSDFRLEPAELTFHYGMPYRLQITNAGRREQTFSAPRFFPATAIRRLQHDGESDDNPQRVAVIIIPPGGSASVEFIPMVRGDYGLRTVTPGRYGKTQTAPIAVR